MINDDLPDDIPIDDLPIDTVDTMVLVKELSTHGEIGGDAILAVAEILGDGALGRDTITKLALMVLDIDDPARTVMGCAVALDLATDHLDDADFNRWTQAMLLIVQCCRNQRNASRFEAMNHQSDEPLVPII